MTTHDDAHELGCTAYVGRPCICRQLRLERGPHATPAPGCLQCEDDLSDARQVESDAPWNDPL